MRGAALPLRLALTAALFAGLGASARGQETQAAAGDPPGRVGRLSYMEGTVSFHTADANQWSPATLNYPVTTGASFWTQPSSRSEIQVGAVEVRMDQSTELDVTRLDDSATQFQVQQGDINLHVGDMPPGGVSVQTARGQIDILAPGSYHIDGGQPNGGAPPDHVQVTVLEGSARYDGPRSTVEIQPGESAQVGGDPISVTLVEGNPTPFDDWALTRERREAAVQAVRYVPPQMTGYQDLDAAGQWASTPDYGQVWYPSAVPADWAPYRYGHWAYVPPWGWTWIDDAPWGFAPFHYGRWVTVGGRWGWCPVVPGAVAVQPYYAPALVAFVGGPGFGVSLSAGGLSAAVGWVPLAPFEPFHPWYHASPRYVRSVNVMNVNRSVINKITVNNGFTVNHFRNREAATVVTAGAFTHAAPVQRATVAIPRGQLATARVAPNMREFRATPEARAAVARPNAAMVARPNAPATIAHGPIPASTQARERSEPMPRAPGPTVRPAMTRPAPAARTGGPAQASAPPQQRNAPRAGRQPGGAPGPSMRPAPATRTGGPAQASVPPQRRNAPRAEKQPGGAPGPSIRPTGAPSAARPASQPPVPAATIRRNQEQPRAAEQAHPQRPARPAQVRPQNNAARPLQQSPRPAEQMQRPQQQTHLQATPQGWKRQPAAEERKPQERQPEEKKP